MKNLTRAAVAATILGSTGVQAYSFTASVGAARTVKNLQYKHKTTDGNNSSGMKSMDFNVSGHVQPMEEMPFSVGLRFNLINLDKKDVAHESEKTRKALGWELTPEVKAWAPAELLGDVGELFSPYARAGFALEALGSYDMEFKSETGDKYKSTAKTQGFYVGLGTEVSVTENIATLVDYTYSNTTFQQKTGGKKGDRNRLSSHAFMVGGSLKV